MKRVERRVFGGELMAYVVMAVGALMLVVGIYEVATGSQIVQVEAGWTSVIAGSVFAAGGVVTIALGMATRVLQQLAATLATASRTPSVSVEAPDTSPAPLKLPDHAKLEEPPAQDSAKAVDLGEQTSSSLPPKKPKLFGSRPKKSFPPMVGTEQSEPLSAAEHASENAAETRTKSEDTKTAEPSFDDLTLSPSIDDKEHATVRLPDEIAAHPADDFKRVSPSQLEQDSTASRQAAAKSQEPAEVDWLDRALAALDEQIPISSPPLKDTKSSDERDPAEAVEGEIRQPETTFAKAKPVSVEEELRPEVGGSSANNSAVIGRYEADGTSYIMYADGSIEAQSEAGVYRFASMAELRAHIEG